MMITVSITVEEYRALEKLAQHRAGMDGATLLRSFVGDLVDSEWTGRMFSHQWLDRRYGPEWMAEKLHHQEKGES